MEAIDWRQDEWFGDEPFAKLWPESWAGSGGPLVARRYDNRRDSSGVSSARFIEYIVKDEAGVAVGGARVVPFRTSADANNSRAQDAQEGTIETSAADGSVRVGVPTADQYYLVGYNGAGTKAGASVNTLVGV